MRIRKLEALLAACTPGERARAQLQGCTNQYLAAELTVGSQKRQDFPLARGTPHVILMRQRVGEKGLSGRRHIIAALTRGTKLAALKAHASEDIGVKRLVAARGARRGKVLDEVGAAIPRDAVARNNRSR